MGTSDNKWIDDIQDRLGGYTEAPSPGLWDAISSRIAPMTTAPLPLYRRPYVRYAAELAIVTLVAAIGFFLSPRQSDAQADYADNTERHDAIESSPTEPSIDAPMVDDRVAVAPVLTGADTQSAHLIAKTDRQPVVTQAVASEPDGQECEIKEGTNQAKDDANKDTNGMTVSDDIANPNSNLIYVNTLTNHPKRLAMAIYTNSSIGGSVGAQYTDVTARTASRGMPSRSTVGEKWHPAVPLTFGVSLRYKLSQRIGIESGLSLTYLDQQRDFYFSDGMVVEDKSEVVYMGIPIKISFLIAEWGKVSVYTSARGKYERMISNENNLISSTVPVTDGLDRERLRTQWSVSGALGIQYDFIKNMGIYVEPGFGYYFKDSDRSTIVYSKYPRVFQIETGLRVDF